LNEQPTKQERGRVSKNKQTGHFSSFFSSSQLLILPYLQLVILPFSSF